jgi:photosystem II stability/assembly factor-like uncharacterized protein
VNRLTVRLFVLVMLLAAAAGTAGVRAPAASAAGAAPPARWTFALYVNGDNDLDYTWERFTLPALQRIPASAGLNVVAMVDMPGHKNVKLYQISGASVTKIASWPSKDFGSPITFAWFLKQVKLRFPSEHLAVTAWDHGYGWRYFSRDFTSGSRITMPELHRALLSARVHLDILAFDACNMAEAGVIDTVADTRLVDYLVASEETIDQDGYPYDNMLGPLAADPGRSPRRLAVDMVAGWTRYYRPLRNFNWVSLSALDLTKMARLQADFTTLVARLRADLPFYRSRYAAALNRSFSAWDSWYVDLADVASHLYGDRGIKDSRLKAAASAVVRDVAAMRVALSRGSYAVNFTGLTVWWGTGSDWRADAHAYTEVPFAWQTGWWRFLQSYNAGVRGPSTAPSPALGRAELGFADVALSDALHGWAAGYDNVTNLPVLATTIDGGRHWRCADSSDSYNYAFNTVAASSGTRVWAAGGEGDGESAIVASSDAGRTWAPQSSGTLEYLVSADFVSASRGWLGATGGLMLDTSDGGQTWKTQAGSSPADVWGVDFVDADRGWRATGDGAAPGGVRGSLEATSDGGTSWQTQWTVRGAVASAVAFSPDGLHGLAVGGDPKGGNGFVCRTTDGGAHWTKVWGSSGAPWLCDVTLAGGSGAVAVAVGEKGALLRSTDGGATWQRRATPLRADLTAVSFGDAAHGFVSADSDWLLKTDDGGSTWQRVLVAPRAGAAAAQGSGAAAPAGTAAPRPAQLWPMHHRR